MTRARPPLAVGVPAALALSQGGGLAVFGAVALGVLLWRRRSGDGPGESSPALSVQTVAQLVGFALALGAWLWCVQEGLGAPRARFGAGVTACALGVVAVRCLWRVGTAGHVGTLGVTLVALMGMSRLVSAPLFGVATVLCLALGLASLLARDDAFEALGARRARQSFAYLRAWGVVATLTLALGLALPAAEPRVSEYIEPYLGEGAVANAGYQDGNAPIGGLSEVLDSSEVWLRIFTPSARPLAVDRLRAQVYRDYRDGTWRAPAPRPLSAAPTLRDAEPAVVVEHTDRLLRTLPLPAGAARLGGTLPGVTLNDLGIARRAEHDEGERFTFAPVPQQGPQAAGPARVAPDTSDVFVPQALRRPLEAWLTTHQIPRMPERAVVAALTKALDAYTYRLEFGDDWTEADPVIDFLERIKGGHCELFASAFVLLARSRGVAARYVTGFRVHEYNPWGQWSVVRGRDAHAWAEVALEGEWVEVDPTPAAAFESDEDRLMGVWPTALDVASRWSSQAFTRLQALSDAELATALLLAGLLGATLLRVRARRAPLSGSPHREQRDALVVALDSALERLGCPRPPHVGPFTHAATCEAKGLDDAAHALRALDALVYSGRGDAEQLARAITALDAIRAAQR